MLLKEVTLKNFRGIQSGTLKFDQSPFVLLGPNGSGKSSFGVYSVPFCFWGYSPWKLENTLRWGADKGYVEVKFKADNDKTYRATRTFDDTSSKFRIYTENGDEDLGGGKNKPNENFFKKLFPVPKEVALQVMFKLQSNALGSFCSATSAGKYNILKNFIDVEKYKDYKDKANETLSELKDKKSELKGKIESSKQALEGLEYTDLEPKRNKLKELGRKKEEVLELIDKAKEQKKALKEYKEAQEFLNKYPDIEDWYQKWQPLKTIREPEVKYDEQEYESTKDNIEDNKESIRKLEEELEAKNSELTEVKENYEEELADYEKQLEELEGLEHQKILLEEGKCPECERYFRNTDERIEDIEGQINTLEDTIKEPNKDPVNDLRYLIDNMEREISELKKETNYLEKKAIRLENNKEETKRWHRREQFKNDYPYEESPDDLFRKFLNAKEVDEPEIDKKLDLKELKESKIELQKDYDDLNQEISRLRENNKTFNLHTEIIDSAKKEIEETSSSLNKYKSLSNIYSKKGLPHFMTRDFLTNLQLYSNQFLKQFTNNRFSVEFKTTIEGQKNIQMKIYDSERGNKARPYSTLSGGEKMRVAVCIEVLGMKETYESLNGVEINSIILDEVPWIDENGAESYNKVLERIDAKVVCGVVCKESMGNHFEKVKRVRRGKVI